MTGLVAALEKVFDRAFLYPHLRRRAKAIIQFSFNCAGAAYKYRSFRASGKIIADINKKMRDIAHELSVPNSSEIPKILHFIYGFKKSEELPFYAYMAVLSALHYNPGWRAVFHYHNEPTGVHWEKLKPRLSLNYVGDFDFFGIAPVQHYAHKADIVRLLALKNIGGAYLDIDTLTAKCFDPLVRNEFVMGIQANINNYKGGLCNAVMLSKPRSRFVTRWLSEYASFCSKGRDGLWDHHSVKLPALLSYSYPEEITVLDHDAFFYPLWMDVDRVLLNAKSGRWKKYLNGAFVFHLWNTFNEDIINSIDQKYVMTSKSVYAEIARLALRADN